MTCPLCKKEFVIMKQKHQPDPYIKVVECTECGFESLYDQNAEDPIKQLEAKIKNFKLQ